MRTQVIICCRQETTAVSSIREGAYRFNPDRPLKWVQRLCFYVLDYLNCLDYTITHEVKIHTIDSDDFMARALEQWEWLQEDLTIHPRTLLLGPEEYNKISLLKDPISMGFTFDLRYQHLSHWHSLKIRVVPWMRGVLILE